MSTPSRQIEASKRRRQRRVIPPAAKERLERAREVFPLIR